jgi:hypothetical protein
MKKFLGLRRRAGSIFGDRLWLAPWPMTIFRHDDLDGTSAGCLRSWPGAEPGGRPSTPGVSRAWRTSADRHAAQDRPLSCRRGRGANSMHRLVHWHTGLGAHSRPRRPSLPCHMRVRAKRRVDAVAGSCDLSRLFSAQARTRVPGQMGGLRT